MDRVELIEKLLVESKNKIINHPIYKEIRTLDDLRIFMEFHVFAVWDFMSLLKGLQGKLTPTDIPWLPKKNYLAVRFINEIALAEESDSSWDGTPLSHFDMYIKAMEQSKANYQPIKFFLNCLQKRTSVSEALETAGIHPGIKKFVSSTFRVIGSGESHKISASFTFARENLVPQMFSEMVSELSNKFPGYLDFFLFYLKRHIEIDSGSHGPLSHQLIHSLCGEDSTKWNEVAKVAEEALVHRLEFWDAIHLAIAKARLNPLK